MEIIKQGFEWISRPEDVLEHIERCGRTCYKSEDKITQGSAHKFVKMIIGKGHETVIEHASVSIRLTTNRGVSHEFVRHRLFSISQESTRYVNYKGGMQFIKPIWWDVWSEYEKAIWLKSMEDSEKAYIELIQSGSRPEQAREVLPNSLKTELVGTANMREWRHTFNMRCQAAAHPQIRALMIPVLKEFTIAFPVLFDDLAVKYIP